MCKQIFLRQVNLFTYDCYASGILQTQVIYNNIMVDVIFSTSDTLDEKAKTVCYNQTCASMF